MPSDEPSYANYTRNDSNLLKRWVQRRRMADAIKLAKRYGSPRLVVDYGAGDGAISAALADAFPTAEILCFEPVANLRMEAEELLKNRSAIRIVGDEADIPTAVADIVVCTEVFEHLPPEPFDCALSEIARALRPGGVAIFGVPIETGPPALAKGLFRMARRFGAEDAQAGRVLSAAMGIAPKREARPVGTDQRPFYYAHLGFDHRDFAQRLAKTYHVQHTHFSPAGSLGAWFNSEVYYIARPER